MQQLVREGGILDSGEVLYLVPTWINELLLAIMDHDLADENKEKFWKRELQEFSREDNDVYFELKKTHDNFPSTGILTVRYLQFLWRNVEEAGEKTFLKSFLDTMSLNGVIFQGNPSQIHTKHDENAGDDNVKRFLLYIAEAIGKVFQGNPSGADHECPKVALDDRTELFVPLHLPLNILENDLEGSTLELQRQFRKEVVYEVEQSYVPPGLLGLLMARFLSKGVEFRKCWGRGAIFILKQVLVLLHLDTSCRGVDEARITVHFFGEKYVSKIGEVMDKVEQVIKSTFSERFAGLFYGMKRGYPKEFDGFNASDSMTTMVAKIDGLKAHIDGELSLLLRGLQQLEDKLLHGAECSHRMLARLDNLQAVNIPCPRLFIVRPAAAMASDGQDRSLWATVKGLNRRATKFVSKDMRLCFICPYNFREVPCGLDGNGYPFTVTRDWIAKISLALKVKHYTSYFTWYMGLLRACVQC